MLKTPLYDEHLLLDGKIVEFAGYLLPVQYPTGVIFEHNAVREKVGLFDVSHMGEIILKGKDALKNLNYLLTNDFTNLMIGRVRYSIMCYPDGGCVDDLIVYRLDEEEYFIVVNAANKDKDVDWIKDHLSGEVEMIDASNDYAQLALQGPLAKEVLEPYCELPEKYYHFLKTKLFDKEVIISQTGYTGSFGYEIYCSPNDVVEIWKKILSNERVVPCGLGARDTLRLEASMPLYGHEISKDINPLEANLDFGIKMNKDFIGKEGLQKEVNRHRIGIKMVGRGIAREQCDIYLNDQKIGFVTSGTHCPYLKGAYAMGLVEGKLDIGTELLIDIRGRKTEAVVVEMPFYQRGGK